MSESNNLHRVDLNLLVALNALLEERNVTRAADRLFITQPAMSRTLGRLRDLFDDPLFTRTKAGLEPTLKALELEKDVLAILKQVRTMLSNKEFEPSSYKGEFTLSVPDIFSQQLYPALMQELKEKAPDIRIRDKDVTEMVYREMDAGNIDFSIYIERQLPTRFTQHNVGEINGIIVCRKGHPLLKTNATLKQMMSYPFVFLSTPLVGKPGQGIADTKLNELGYKRNIIFETPSLQTALNTVVTGDYLMFLPEFIYKNTSKDLKLEYIPIPKKLGISTMNVTLISHQRTKDNPAHTWLESILVDIAQRILKK